jgi:hypothetical protein
VITFQGSAAPATYGFESCSLTSVSGPGSSTLTLTGDPGGQLANIENTGCTLTGFPKGTILLADSNQTWTDSLLGPQALTNNEGGGSTDDGVSWRFETIPTMTDTSNGQTQDPVTTQMQFIAVPG